MSLPPFACAKLGLEVQQALTQPAIPSLIEGPMRPCDVRLFANGVVNAASFAPPEVSHGKLSPGSIITLFGQGLGSTEGVELAFPLSAEVNGIRVRVSNGNETVDALPLFSNGAQINAVLTNATPRGPVAIWAEVDGEMINEVPVEVVDAAVGLFAIEGSYGIVQKADAEFSLVGPDNPLHPGDILIAWGTGAGQTATPSELPPEAEDLGGVRVFLGDVEASRVLYAVPSPCCSGIHQFVFEASRETPGGSYVPLIVETDNGGVSNAVLLDVDDGSVDELNPRKPLAGERLNKGEIRLRSRLRPQSSGAIEAREIIEARSERDRRFDFTPQIDFPPPGTCWFGNRSGNSERDVLQPMPVEPLRPGEITVTTEDGDTVFLSPIFDGVLGWAREIFLASFGPPGLEASLRAGAFIQLLTVFAMTHEDPDEIADFAEYLVEHLTGPSRNRRPAPAKRQTASRRAADPGPHRARGKLHSRVERRRHRDRCRLRTGVRSGREQRRGVLLYSRSRRGTFEVPRRALRNMPATPADREGFLAVGVVRKLSERTEASVEGLDRLTISEDLSIATGARFN